MEKNLKFAILIVAYNAINTLTRVLDRIPKEVWDEVEEVFIFDDCSKDETALLGEGYKLKKGLQKLNIYRNERNLGYGGNQKRGYKYAIEKGYDYVILLHGDGQYAPEYLPHFIRAAKEERPAAVIGSRMLIKKNALKGGMPLYKFLGNIILTTYQNLMLNTKMSEFHSGYRMYSTEALKKLHLDKYTDDFHFDTQILVELIHNNEKIIEIPVPTFYGDEICYVNGIKYAFNVFKSVLRYKLWSIGLLSCEWIEPFSKTKYSPKKSPLSSHKRIAKLVPQNSCVLDLGAEGNYIDDLNNKNCYIIGINIEKIVQEISAKYNEFYTFDIEKSGWPKKLSNKKFDVIILADVIEHLKNPKPLISSLKDLLKKEGLIIASTPNIAHFLVRFLLLLGFFPYGTRGILDESHLHFYTLRSFKKLFEKEGYKLLNKKFTPIPFELFAGKSNFSKKIMLCLEYLYYFFVKISPSLFAYQMIYILKKNEKI